MITHPVGVTKTGVVNALDCLVCETILMCLLMKGKAKAILMARHLSHHYNGSTVLLKQLAEVAIIAEVFYPTV